MAPVRSHGPSSRPWRSHDPAGQLANDPKAVEQALQGYAKATTAAANSNGKSANPSTQANDLADALIAMERDRERARRADQAQTGRMLTHEPHDSLDLWAVGMALVWAVMS